MKKLLGILIAVILWAGIASAQSTILTWNDNSNDELGFGIERRLNGGPFTVIFKAIGANVTSVTDSGVVVPTACGTTNVYDYRAYAFNAVGNSAYSNTASKSFAGPACTVPNAPSGLTTAAISNTVIELSWANNNPEPIPTLISRRPGGSPEIDKQMVAIAGRTSYRDRELPSRSTYCYTVQARREDTLSERSNLSCATTR